MEQKEIVLSVKDLRVNFSTDHGYVQAVRGVSFDLYKGETLCIVGESGSGKSVTSKTIMGILAANGRIVGGSIMYQGEDLTKVSEDEFHRIRGNKIGMIFQDPLSSLNPIVRIGKQITEAMLVNSSRIKRLYEEKVADELVAYRNAQTELKSGLAKGPELVKFLKSEKKKEIAKAKNYAHNEKESRLYTLKQSYGATEFAIKNDKSLSSIEKSKRLKELKEKTAQEKKNIQQFTVNLNKSTKENVAKVKQEFDQKIAEAKEKCNSERDSLKATYKPLIKENKAKFKAASKKAKAEVKEYKYELKSKCKEDIEKMKVEIDDDEERKAKIEERKKEYISSIKITKSEAKARALKIMAEVGIPNPEKRFRQYPFEFSGGMRQRIVIAIALTADPDILICDEPTTALDVTIQAQILELINRLKHERNLSCIFITHDLGVVANMADRVAVMYAGKIVEYGLEEDIFYDPRHPYTWALLSSIPDIDSKEKLEAIPGTPPNMIYPPVGDAFALRSKYAMAIDFKKEPPLFKISDTHYAATWLLDPRAPKVEMPKIVKTRIENSLKAARKGAKK